MAIHDPVAHIKIVHVLLADMVAAQPDVVVPIPNLALEISIATVAAVPDWSAVDPVSSQRDHIADFAVVDPFDGLDITRLVPTLSASGDLQVFIFRHFRGLVHEAASRAVHRYGLFHENVLARFNAGAEVAGSKTRGRRQDAIIDSRDRQCFLIRIEPAKALFIRNSEILLAALRLFGEQVRDSNDVALDAQVLDGFAKVLPCPATTPSNTDDHGVNRLFVRGPDY